MNGVSIMSEQKRREYDEVVKEADAAQACPYRHSCNRRDHIMTEWYSGVRQDECEVWDKYYHGDKSDTHEVVFGGSKRECVSFLQDKDSSRFYLVDNTKCVVCDMYEKRKAAVAQGKQPSFLIVCYGISSAYGGPEEGGWWYDIEQVLEVRKAFTFEEGLRHARELRDEYPQPRYNRHSCANRGEDDIYIRCVYAENDPRMPEDSPPGRPIYQ